MTTKEKISTTKTISSRFHNVRESPMNTQNENKISFLVDEISKKAKKCPYMNYIYYKYNIYNLNKR